MVDVSRRGVTRAEVLLRAETILKYSWGDQELLATALRHSSWCNENKGVGECNERLEWLGDTVLDMLVADDLFRRNPQLREGALSKLRAQRVCTETLATIVRRLGLHSLLYLAKGSQYLREQDGVLADLMEAIVGAAYMDGGMRSAAQISRRVGIL